MTPAAQVFSASEILQEILNGKREDLLLKQWGKSNRYAGSKELVVPRKRAWEL